MTPPRSVTLAINVRPKVYGILQSTREDIKQSDAMSDEDLVLWIIENYTNLYTLYKHRGFEILELESELERLRKVKIAVDLIDLLKQRSDIDKKINDLI